MSFKKNKYQIIRKAISKELADVCYRYLAINYNADAYLINNNVYTLSCITKKLLFYMLHLRNIFMLI